MELTFPAYYPDFVCTADRCRDNCCRTPWEIVVDRATVGYYRSLPEPLRSRLLAGLAEDESGDVLIRPEGGQCPFLTEQGLCSLVLELGEEHIGEICALHPRYREWFPGRMEIGVGLCCEEAARLILSDPAPAEFETCLTDAEDEEEEDVPLYLPLLELRDRLFSLVQDRTRPLSRRLASCLRLAVSVQEQINRGEVPDPASPLSPLEAEPGRPVLSAAAALHREMEALEPSWTRDLEDLWAHREELDWSGFADALGERVYAYEHMAVYLLFRYFLKGVYDENPLVKVQQAVVMLLMTAALGVRVWQRTGAFPLARQIETARQYSKEVEYSEDNMELLAEGFLFQPELSTAALLGALETEKGL